MSTTDSLFYSRSALAEKLNLSLKELTQLMLSGGWIIESTKGLELTEKGKFEGGKYRQSNKYGQYIVWPESVIEHALLRYVDESAVTISQLVKPSQLPPRLFNRLLAELGWIKTFSKGWKVTQQGIQQGGVQHENDSSGMPYVKWPRDLLSNQSIVNALTLLNVSDSQENKSSGLINTLNGLLVESVGHAKIVNWLYLLGFTTSYQRELITVDKQSVILDLYLPEYGLVIDYWDESLKSEQLSANLNKQSLFSTLNLQVIEINHQQLEALDFVLSKELLQLGINTY